MGLAPPAQLGLMCVHGWLLAPREWKPQPSLRHTSWEWVVVPPQVLPLAEDWLSGVPGGTPAGATSLKAELLSELELSEEQQLQVNVGALRSWQEGGACRVPQIPPLTLGSHRSLRSWSTCRSQPIACKSNMRLKSLSLRVR